MSGLRRACLFFASLVAITASASTFADRSRDYEVTITNITKGQSFTPQLVATHDHTVALFELAQPASLSLEILAEAGNTTPLSNDLLASGDHVSEVLTIPGLLGPGQSVSTIVEADLFHRYLSVAAMMLPTHDNFIALNRVALPTWGSRSYTVLGYDAGTEENTQNCLSIPGPVCGGQAHSPGPNPGDEGFVHVSPGFHELGSDDGAGNVILSPVDYDWRNPVAVVTIKRVN